MFKTLFSGLPALYFANIVLAINGVWCKKIPLDALSITALRCLVAVLALAGFIQALKHPWGFKQKKVQAQAAVLGVLMGIHWAAFFYAMQISTVAMGILALYSSPVFTVIMEPLLNKTRPKGLDMLLALAVLMGLALMVQHWDWHDQSLQGLLYGLVSAISYTLRNVLQRRWLQQESGLQAMALQVMVAGLLCVPFLNIPKTLALTPLEWGYLLALALMSTALAHTLIVFSLKVLQAKTVSLISCFQPVLAIGFGWWLLNEQPTAATVWGGGIILSCALYETLRQQAITK